MLSLQSLSLVYFATNWLNRCDSEEFQSYQRKWEIAHLIHHAELHAEWERVEAHPMALRSNSTRVHFVNSACGGPQYYAAHE